MWSVEWTCASNNPAPLHQDSSSTGLIVDPPLLITSVDTGPVSEGQCNVRQRYFVNGACFTSFSRF